MKGIILAGGHGTRLNPTTLGISKHLIPVYDKPMIYYPLSVLMLAKIRDILIISSKGDIDNYRRLLGDGSKFGVNFTYAIQQKPQGIAQSLLIGKEFIDSDSVCLILGDNIFYGYNLTSRLKAAKERAEINGVSTLFTSPVKNPKEFGIIEYKTDGSMSKIIEKPEKPSSNTAVTGLYFYSNEVVEFAEYIEPSARGELEITDINNRCISENRLICEYLGRGFAWLDTGTIDALMDASNFVQAVEKRQGYKIACLEEIALKNGWVSRELVLQSARKLSKSEYGKYLLKLLEE